MKRRQFSQFIVGLSTISFIGCKDNKSNVLGPAKVIEILSQNNLYGVKILKMLQPDLSGQTLEINQLQIVYPQLFKIRDKGILIQKANELVQNDFSQNNFILISGHMFSRLELTIYKLSNKL